MCFFINTPGLHELEIRSTKSEIRNNIEIQKTKYLKPDFKFFANLYVPEAQSLNFWHSVFEFVSDFDIRISSFILRFQLLLCHIDVNLSMQNQGPGITLIRQSPQRFENQCNPHGKHAGQTHTTGKAGQQYRGILAPHGTIPFHEKETTQ